MTPAEWFAAVCAADRRSVSNESRPFPVTVGGEAWAAATTGTILVATRGALDGADPEWKDRTAAERLIADAANGVRATLDDAAGMVARLVPLVECAACHRTGRAPCECGNGKEQCGDCEGEGTCQCPTCGADHECGSCDGRGTRVCSQCNGKKSARCVACPERYVPLAGRVFDAWLLRLALLGASGSANVGPVGEKTGVLSFFGDGWLALIMPTRTDATEEAIVLTEVAK